MRESSNLKRVSDDELLRRLSDLVTRARGLHAEVVAHIAEVDARRLYAREATPSMFAYCVEVLHLGENEAYLRIAAARASRKYPSILEMLREGRLHLSAAARLASHLTPENCEAVLKRAEHRSKREVEELIAELDPRPEVRSAIRKLPSPRRPSQLVPEPVESGAINTGSSLSPGDDGEAASGEGVAPDTVAPPGAAVLPGVAAPSAAAPSAAAPSPAAPSAAAPSAAAPSAAAPSAARRATIEPLAPSRHKVQFTASDELRHKLEELQALMRETVPDGDLATVIDLAVTEKLERLKAKRFAETSRPKKTLAESNSTSSSRHIPAPVRRAVRKRDQGRCTYQDARGRRCRARERLEFHHHRRPFGKGGEHSVENIRLMCHTHNRLLAEVEHGRNEDGEVPTGRGRPRACLGDHRCLRGRRRGTLSRRGCPTRGRPGAGWDLRISY